MRNEAIPNKITFPHNHIPQQIAVKLVSKINLKEINEKQPLKLNLTPFNGLWLYCASSSNQNLSLGRVKSIKASGYQFSLGKKNLSIPSPNLDVLMSESSLVPFWDSRYVAGTHPCSSAVLTNHQPTRRSKKSFSVNIQRNKNSKMLQRRWQSQQLWFMFEVFCSFLEQERVQCYYTISIRSPPSGSVQACQKKGAMKQIPIYFKKFKVHP